MTQLVHWPVPATIVVALLGAIFIRDTVDKVYNRLFLLSRHVWRFRGG